jgi:hypothetical protein
MGKVKGAQHTTWGHHDTMIVNLRDWVSRELNTLRLDLAREAPNLADNPDVMRTLSSADDMNARLFDLIRSVVDLAEKKSKAKPVPAEKEEELDVD